MSGAKRFYLSRESSATQLVFLEVLNITYQYVLITIQVDNTDDVQHLDQDECLNIISECGLTETLTVRLKII